MAFRWEEDNGHGYTHFLEWTERADLEKVDWLRAQIDKLVGDWSQSPIIGRRTSLLTPMGFWIKGAAINDAASC